MSTLINDKENKKGSQSSKQLKNKEINLVKTQVTMPQQLTILNPFDPEDNATIHYTASNTSHWLSDKSSHLNTDSSSTLSSLGNDLSFNKLLPLNKLNKNHLHNENKNQTLFKGNNNNNNFSFFSSNWLNLNVKGRNNGVNSNNINDSLNKHISSSSYLDSNNKNSYKNSGSKSNRNSFDSKYMDYRRKWMEILRRDKKIFESKWNSFNNVSVNNQSKLDDYELKKTLGNGSFGRVILVKHKENGKFFALKVLEKKNVVKSRQVEHTLNEKKIMSSVNFPFIASFICSFKDNSNLFIVLEFVSGGEMFKHLVRTNRFSENLSKFYCAQVILAIEYLHNLDIIHRDLKPENTLISQDGYIKITDFGFAKYVKTRTYTLCGTPEYLAPEIIQSKPYGKPVDWWSIGILTYEMSTGRPPFQSDQPLKIYEKILAGKYKIPSYLSEDIKDFMRCLIQSDVTKRYGNLKNGVDDIKTHKWFNGIDWMSIYNKKMTSPMIPKIKSPGDTSNFDNYSEQTINVSKEMSYEKEFIDF